MCSGRTKNKRETPKNDVKYLNEVHDRKYTYSYTEAKGESKINVLI